MFGTIGQLATARPWLVVAIWIVAAAGIIGFAPHVSGVTNSDQSAFLPASAESAKAADLASRAFPGTHGATAVLVVTRTDGQPLGTTDIATIGRLAGGLRAPAVAGVQFDPQQMVAANRSVALVGIQFTGAAQAAPVKQAVAALRTTATTALAGTGLRADMTGQAAIVVDNANAFARATTIVTLATVALIVVLLLLVFRSPIAALFPLLTVGLVFGIAESTIAALATWFHFKVGQELPTMLTVVLFGIGTDYILFLLFRYRERLRAGDSPRAAIVYAVQRVGEA